MVIIFILLIILLVLRIKNENFIDKTELDDFLYEISKSGEQGLQGPIGFRGATGPPGDTGKKGTKGKKGLNGLPGPRGDTGDTGERGNRGTLGRCTPGKNGDTGERGRKGAIGRTGPEGPKGDQGPIGNIGVVTEKLCIGSLCMTEDIIKRLNTEFSKKKILVGPTPHLLRKNYLLDVINITASYRLSFDIKINETIGGVGSILHFTNLHDAGAYHLGDLRRAPAIWLHPNSKKLQIVVGNQADGNWNRCDVKNITLRLGHWDKFILAVTGQTVEIYINGIPKCYAPKDNISTLTNLTTPLPGYCHDSGNIKVYAGNPFHSPADGYIRNVVYERYF